MSEEKLPKTAKNLSPKIDKNVLIWIIFLLVLLVIILTSTLIFLSFNNPKLTQNPKDNPTEPATPSESQDQSPVPAQPEQD